MVIEKATPPAFPRRAWERSGFCAGSTDDPYRLSLGRRPELSPSSGTHRPAVQWTRCSDFSATWLPAELRRVPSRSACCRSCAACPGRATWRARRHLGHKLAAMGRDTVRQRRHRRVLVNINPAYRAHELAYVLNQADITTLLLTDQFKTSNYFDILAAVCPELSASLPGELHAAACPRLRHVISIKPAKRPGMIAWDEFRGLAARIDDAVRMRRAD